MKHKFILSVGVFLFAALVLFDESLRAGEGPELSKDDRKVEGNRPRLRQRIRFRRSALRPHRRGRDGEARKRRGAGGEIVGQFMRTPGSIAVSASDKERHDDDASL